jgi:selT/selW/selH-like putative selenoprotein
MKITIEYCVVWNYEPRARSLRDDLIKEFQDRFEEFSVEPIQSSGGVFEVIVNEHLQVFSKKQTGRFPNSSYEVVKTINDAIDERRLS